MKRAKFWSRISRNKSAEWVLMECDDPSQVPVEAWKLFNKIFHEQLESGILRPADPLDAYQTACQEMIKVAKSNQDPKYLAGVGRMVLKNFVSRKVGPLRQEHAALFDKGEVELEGEVKSMIAAINAKRAKECVYRTLRCLDFDANLGLRNWLYADGIWLDAAKYYGASIAAYQYRFKHIWAPEFREACEWRW